VVLAIRLLAAQLIVSVAALTTSLAACPFCTASRPTLGQLRDRAVMVFLAEAGERHQDHQWFQVHRVLKGDATIAHEKGIDISGTQPVEVGHLVLVFANRNSGAELHYKLIPANETRAAYLAQAPDLRSDGADRLRYFARFLTHSDTLISKDAFDEFAIAPLDDVRPTVPHLPLDQFRRWISQEEVPEERAGFLGLVLGLEPENEHRAKNLALLRELVRSPKGDFRGGFDGILAGYLLCGGRPAMEDVCQRYLTDPTARLIDVRHALNAIRFYYEQAKPDERAVLRRAVRGLLGRPEVAAAAISDLARWQDWESLEDVVKTLKRAGNGASDVRQAACCFLVVCPTEAAQAHLEQLRAIHGEEIKAAEIAVGPGTDDS
jgi:hypothetical protein